MHSISWIAVALIGLTGTLVHCQTSLNTFYTTEFPEYSTDRETVYTVFTCEAPSEVSAQAALSLTTVLDTSGSMRGTPIELLKRTVQFLVRKLLETSGVHSLGVIGYDTDVTELSEVVSVDDSSAPSLLQVIEDIVARGSTFLSGGLNAGVQQQAEVGGSKVKNVYLFTDGLPTVGPTSVSEVLNALDNVIAESDASITISTFGFGANLDFELLSSIAEAGGGETYIISTEDDIPAAFGKALGGLLSIVASDLEIVLSPRSGCTISDIMSGGVSSDDDGIYTIRFENLYANEFRDILLEIEMEEGEAGNQSCIEATVSYLDLATNERRTNDPVLLEISRVADTDPALPPDIRVEENRLKFVTAEALAEARASVNQGDSAGAVQAIAIAQASVNVSVLVDTPEIQALEQDLERIIELLEQSQENQVAQAARISELETALREQRSTSTDDTFETAREVETEEQQVVQQETRDAVLSETDLATTAPVPETQSSEQSVEPEEEDSTSDVTVPEAPSAEDMVSSDESQMGSMEPEEEADAGAISPDAPVVEEQEQVPDTESEVLIVPDTEPTVSIVPETEPSVLVVPETEPEVIVAPDTEPSVLVVPDTEPAVTLVPNTEPIVSVVPDTEPSVATPDESGSDSTVVSTPVQENNAGMMVDSSRPNPEAESVSVDP